MNTSEELLLTPVAFVESDFWAQEAIPRQAGLVRQHPSIITFERTPQNEHLLLGIEEFSHLWIIFWLHAIGARKRQKVVHPPRTTVNTRGTFATRSPYRPNPLGLSVVTLKEKELTPEALKLHIEGADLLHGTPVLDIKPYVPYADAIPDATAGWATEKPPTLDVFWTETAEQSLQQHVDHDSDYHSIITEIIAQDPRPFHHKGTQGSEKNEWKCRYGSVLIRWNVVGSQARIIKLEKLNRILDI